MSKNSTLSAFINQGDSRFTKRKYLYLGYLTTGWLLQQFVKLDRTTWTHREHDLGLSLPHFFLPHKSEWYVINKIYQLAKKGKCWIWIFFPLSYFTSQENFRHWCFLMNFGSVGLWSKTSSRGSPRLTTTNEPQIPVAKWDSR